jgi:hypothetical protein
VEHAGTVRAEIVEAHASRTELPPERVRKWIAMAGRARAPSVVRFVTARLAAEREAGQPVPTPEAMWRLYRLVLRSAFRDPVELSDLAVSGDELRSAGVDEGPAMGWVLHRLLEVVLEHPSRNTVDELLRLAAEFATRYRNGER